MGVEKAATTVVRRTRHRHLRQRRYYDLNDFDINPEAKNNADRENESALFGESGFDNVCRSGKHSEAVRSFGMTAWTISFHESPGDRRCRYSVRLGSNRRFRRQD